MKQNITEKQFNELSKGGKISLFYWVTGVKIPYYSSFDAIIISNPDLKNRLLLSIGQMIEFLSSQEHGISDDSYLDSSYEHVLNVLHPGIGWDGDLCDALWEPVKKILNGVEKS